MKYADIYGFVDKYMQYKIFIRTQFLNKKICKPNSIEKYSSGFIQNKSTTIYNVNTIFRR